MRRNDASIKALASGLRALRLLARIAPANLHEFCAATNLSITEARALIGVFRDTGFVENGLDTTSLTLTPLAFAVLTAKEPLPGFAANIGDPRKHDPGVMQIFKTLVH